MGMAGEAGEGGAKAVAGVQKGALQGGKKYLVTDSLWGKAGFRGVGTGRVWRSGRVQRWGAGHWGGRKEGRVERAW
jgi:hypothetical protein